MVRCANEWNDKGSKRGDDSFPSSSSSPSLLCHVPKCQIIINSFQMNTEHFSRREEKKKMWAQRKVPHAWHYRINEFCGESNVFVSLKAKINKNFFFLLLLKLSSECRHTNEPVTGYGFWILRNGIMEFFSS